MLLIMVAFRTVCLYIQWLEIHIFTITSRFRNLCIWADSGLVAYSCKWWMLGTMSSQCQEICIFRTFIIKSILGHYHIEFSANRGVQSGRTNCLFSNYFYTVFSTHNHKPGNYIYFWIARIWTLIHSIDK